VFLNESRREYTKYEFDKEMAIESPFKQFEDWFEFAKKNAVFEPNAVHVSTVSNDNKPKNRVVLLKSFDQNGFFFFTNYNSNKSKEIDFNPNVCLTFFWPNIERQVRIEGFAKKVSEKISDDYFNTRPRDSQLSAWASNQSGVIENRQKLDDSLTYFKEKFPTIVPRPTHWGGFCVIPNYFEFWQGRANRYHDRITYKLTNNNWNINRLCP
jgi:pyridoxamine 5'-phosphate oxidase